jgi:hypothetical protein
LIFQTVLLKIERIFSSNWKLNHLTLYKYGSLLIQSYSSSKQTWIKCDKNSTLIVFGKDISSVPKRPELPSGYDEDQLLTIGVMMEEKSASITSIIFYWFLTENLEDLFDWIVAFRTSLIPRPWPTDYEKEERERQEKEAEEAGLGILMAGAGYHAITGCEVTPDFNDYTFPNDFSFCAGF